MKRLLLILILIAPAAAQAQTTGQPLNQTPTGLGHTVTDAASAQIACPQGYTHVEGRVSTTSASSSTLISAPGSGNNIYLLSAQAYNTGATNTHISITQGDYAGTALGDMIAPTNTTPFGGMVVTYPGVLQTKAITGDAGTNRAINVTVDSASTTVYINAQGCTGP